MDADQTPGVVHLRGNLSTSGLDELIKKKHRESTIWQRRFWEHQIRDDDDFARHVDYLHHNPVKHGHVKSVSEWPYSTFHRYVRAGVIARDWAGSADLQVPD